MSVATKEKEVNTVGSPSEEQIYVRSNKGYLICKRVLDILFAASFGIVLLVPMAVIAGLVRLDSKGPAIFKQERLGLNGKPFTMYKFRSMVVDAEANGPCWAEKDDDRCTKIGRILRKTRLDELPQLYNILVGHMSFVGPRPERECFYEEFEKYIPNFRKRLLVQPGLTGHAQVNGGYDLGPEEKLVYDLEYMKNRSMKMDLKCIFKTIAVIISHDGAR